MRQKPKPLRLYSGRIRLQNFIILFIAIISIILYSGCSGCKNNGEKGSSGSTDSTTQSSVTTTAPDSITLYSYTIKPSTIARWLQEDYTGNVEKITFDVYLSPSMKPDKNSFLFSKILYSGDEEDTYDNKGDSIFPSTDPPRKFAISSLSVGNLDLDLSALESYFAKVHAGSNSSLTLSPVIDSSDNMYHLKFRIGLNNSAFQGQRDKGDTSILPQPPPLYPSPPGNP